MAAAAAAAEQATPITAARTSETNPTNPFLRSHASTAWKPTGELSIKREEKGQKFPSLPKQTRSSQHSCSFQLAKIEAQTNLHRYRSCPCTGMGEGKRGAERGCLIYFSWGAAGSGCRGLRAQGWAGARQESGRTSSGGIIKATGEKKPTHSGPPPPCVCRDSGVVGIRVGRYVQVRESACKIRSWMAPAQDLTRPTVFFCGMLCVCALLLFGLVRVRST